MTSPCNQHSCLAANVALPIFVDLTTPTDIHELLVTLSMLTMEMNLKTVVELGTHSVESTTAPVCVTKACERDVYSTDLDDCMVARRAIKNRGLEGQWEFVQADNLEADWMKSIDHLYIDTSHTAEQMLREHQKYEPYARTGGIVTTHDSASFPGVKRGIRSHSRDRNDVRICEYDNNNGLVIRFKERRLVKDFPTESDRR